MGSWFSRRNIMADEDPNRSNSEHSSEYSDGDNDNLNYSDVYNPLTINNFSQIDDDYYGPKPPKIKYKPVTTKLDQSEFKFSTSQSAGVLKHRKALKPSNITSLVTQREKGLRFAEGFNMCNKSRISNKFLPNEMDKLDSYEGKAFIGIFSKDAKYFITATQDQAIRIYNTEEGYDHFKTIYGRGVGWSIIDVAISPNNRDFVYSSWSSSLHLCSILGDPDKQDSLCLITGSKRFCVFSLAFSSDGNEILCGANDGFMYIYNRNINRSTLKIPAHDYDVNSVTFADESSHIICSGGDDGLVKIWDRRMLSDGDNDIDSSCSNRGNATPVGVLAGHKDGVTYVHPRGDGRHLISNSKDQTIKLWDMRVFSSDGGVKNTLRAVNAQSWDYRWQKVPKKLNGTGGRLEGDTSLMTYKGHGVTRTLIRCRFSPAELTGQRYIYTGCGYGRLIIYDALTGRMKRQLCRHSNCVRDVAWHPNRNEIITSSWDGSIGRWYYKNQKAARFVA